MSGSIICLAKYLLYKIQVMEKTHPRFILKEEKSISKEVRQLGDAISRIIFKDSFDKKQYLSQIKNIPYFENTLSISINKILGTDKHNFGFDDLTVSYILYNCDTEEEYQEKVIKDGKCSEASFEDRSILIVSAMIKGYIIPSFIDEIYHELTHLLQYGVGMEKRKELYDNAISLVQNANEDISRTIGSILYYTFKHEQDAMVHQFYSKLMNSHMQSNSFEEFISKSEYGYLVKLRTTYFYYKQFDRDKVTNILLTLGMDCNHFEKRMNYGISRFKTKLKNAYDKYLFDTRQKRLTVESTTRYNMFKNKILVEYQKRYTDIEYKMEEKLYNH